MTKLAEKKLKNIDILECALSRIDLYRNNRQHISQLISSLESYLNQLQVVDEDWKAVYRTFWLDIEIEYAVALEETGREGHSATEVISTALDSLERMVKDKIIVLKCSRL